MRDYRRRKMNAAPKTNPPDLSEFTDILLVEDDPTDAELTLRSLADCGLAPRVEHVTDGSAALDYISSSSVSASKGASAAPRLILLDLKLKGLGGLHVLRGLKTDERTRGIPIVVLTNSKVGIELIESYKLGVNSYVIKPTDSQKFAQTIQAIARYWLSINELPRP